MEPFLSEDFLLDTPAGRRLYHDWAQDAPIIDYHCHIDPRDIYEDRRFDDLAQVWLGGDHYKWRLMRANGVEERYITGDADGWEKFLAFARSLPRAAGNPMLHWCHLELKRYFGWEGFLTGDSARRVWDLCGDRLQNDPSMSARGLIRRSGVAMIGTTDDPCDSLEWHEKLAADRDFDVQVRPTFRPDRAVNIRKDGFAAYLARLGQASGEDVSTARGVCRALSRRMDRFDALGCRAADHGLDYVMFRPGSAEQADRALRKALSGQTVSREEAEVWQTALLLHCAGEYARRGWVMQLHFSCLRDPNSRMLARLGPDTGFDCMAATDSCAALAALLDALDRDGALPRTILYSLNPADNAWLDSLIGAFQSGEVPGKVQHGAAWWFNDTKHGMEEHLTGLAAQSVLGNFVGMLTDSRSLLSYTRHEYFRRVLCGLLGRWIENGEYPADFRLAGGLVRDICCGNAKRYFQLEVSQG